MPTPAAIPVYLSELDAERGGLDMVRAVGKLRDEITAVSMDRHRGNSRELSMVIAKLDEARLWAEEWQVSQGVLVRIPRAEILQIANADTTDTTLPDGGSE